MESCQKLKYTVFPKAQKGPYEKMFLLNLNSANTKFSQNMQNHNECLGSTPVVYDMVQGRIVPKYDVNEWMSCHSD